ncbi:hypothetical protein VI03_07025 [Burkholderia vietnamiensis]|nr:hypothetical protein VI03_07025 [Burkholderia vietnamiensis]
MAQRFVRAMHTSFFLIVKIADSRINDFALAKLRPIFLKQRLARHDVVQLAQLVLGGLQSFDRLAVANVKNW